MVKNLERLNADVDTTIESLGFFGDIVMHPQNLIATSSQA